jgi:hypothetical protein
MTRGVCGLRAAGFYPGESKECMVANALFRMGGAAILFTNK